MARPTLGNVTPPQISHSGHPAHDLRLMPAAPFQCDGCMQNGDGRRYRCQQCNYDLHICCARHQTHLEHPLFEGSRLDFLLNPPPSGFVSGSRFCDACGDQVLGYVYHNRELELDLHPRCALLPQRIVQDGLAFHLDKEAEASLICVLCEQNGRRNSFWSYRSTDGDGELVYLHVRCLQEYGSGSGGQIAQASSPTTQNLQARRISGQIVQPSVPTGQGMPSVPTGQGMPSVAMPTWQGMPSVPMPTWQGMPSVPMPAWHGMPSVPMPTGHGMHPVPARRNDWFSLINTIAEITAALDSGDPGAGLHDG